LGFGLGEEEDEEAAAQRKRVERLDAKTQRRKGTEERRTVHDVSQIEFDDRYRTDVVGVVDVVRICALPC